MRIKYIGPHDRVRLPLPSGRSVELAHGDELDLDDELIPERDQPALVASLLEQPSNWEQVTAKAAKKPAATAAGGSTTAAPAAEQKG